MSTRDIILHISANQFPALSIEHHTKKIWKELACDAAEYHILARSQTNRFENYVEGNLYLHLVPALTKRSYSFFFSSWIMLYYISRYKVNKMIVQCPINGGLAASVYSRICKIPYMVEIHGEEYFTFFQKKYLSHRLLDKILRFVFTRASTIRSLSPKMTVKLNDWGIIQNIREIPNRVNLSLFDKQKQNFEIGQPPHIVSVGRFRAAKNYETLITVCLENNYRLTLIGGGELTQKYQQIIGDNSDTIRLVGAMEQKDFIEIVRNADIYIQSSILEGVPRTIIEAMAMKMPIISTKVGFIEGVLVDGHNALLIDNPLDKREYKEKIERLVSDITLREQIANTAYSDAVNKYEWKRAFALYKKAIADLK